MHLDPSAVSARRARRLVADVARQEGRDDLVDDARSVVSELVSNAVLHARTAITLQVGPAGAGLRIEVSDGSPIMPRWSPVLSTATCGRGLLMVQQLTTEWGVVPDASGGKTIWAQLDHAAVVDEELTPEQELANWTEQVAEPPTDRTGIPVRLDIDVQMMLRSRGHTEDLLRQLQLSLLQADSEWASGDVPADVVQLAHRLITASEALHHVREQMWGGALRAAQQGLPRTTLRLMTHPDDGPAARRWLRALDEADDLANTGKLFLPPFPVEFTAFRREYVHSLADQIDVALALAR